MPRGRPRKPTALKILQGEKRPERLDLDAPRPDRGRPPKPGDLGVIAARKWDEVCVLLDGLGVLTVADGEPIEQYARTYEIWRRAEEAMKRGGRSGGYFTADGCRVKAPVKLFKDLGALLIRLEVEMGLTPSARTRLKADPSEAKLQGKLAKYG